jgi:hypothetical protein
MNVDKPHVRFGESAKRSQLGCCSARPSVVSPHTTVGPGARDLSRRNTGVADRRLEIPMILRFPSLLRTAAVAPKRRFGAPRRRKVRAPFARATTTLNRCARPRAEHRHARTRRMMNVTCGIDQRVGRCAEGSWRRADESRRWRLVMRLLSPVPGALPQAGMSCRPWRHQVRSTTNVQTPEHATHATRLGGALPSSIALVLLSAFPHSWPRRRTK